MRAIGMIIGRTDLRPHHFRERADELRGRVPVPSQSVLVDYLAHGEPQGGFETLLADYFSHAFLERTWCAS